MADEISIFKTDDSKKLVFGWASIAFTADGEQLQDRQQDMIDPDDLEEAAYEYVLQFRDTGEEHIKGLRKKGKLVESCVFTEEKQRAIGIPEGSVPVGWWIGFHIDDDEAWEKIKNGTYKMFSIEGVAQREPIEKSAPTGCGVLVVKDGKLLTATRIDGKGRNRIGGPGGHIEQGETPEQAAKREAQEEFGITCNKLVPLGVADGGKYGVSACFLCTDFTGDPEADEEEMSGAEWLAPEDMDEEKLFLPFAQSLELLEAKIKAQKPVAKTFDEVLKFNPYHGADGRFASSRGFKTFSADASTKAGAAAIARHSANGGDSRMVNSHRTAQGQRIIDQWRQSPDFQQYQQKLQTDIQHCYAINGRIAQKIVNTSHSDITSSDMSVLRNGMKSWKPLPNGDLNTSGYFQTKNSTRINSKIRDNVANGKNWDAGMDSYDKKTVAAMEKGMKPLSKGIQLCRNVDVGALASCGITAADIKSAQRSKKSLQGISDKLLGEWGTNTGYSSCSYDFTNASSFSDRQVRLKISVPKGQKAFVSPTMQEYEVVLPRNTKLKYTGNVRAFKGKDRNTGKPVDCIEVECVAEEL